MFIPDLDFSILDPGSGFFHPRVADPEWTKNFSLFNPKIVYKLSDISSEMFIPDFFHPESGSREQKALDPGSATLI
jgi:hypothetical protein